MRTNIVAGLLVASFASHFQHVVGRAILQPSVVSVDSDLTIGARAIPPPIKPAPVRPPVNGPDHVNAPDAPEGLTGNPKGGKDPDGTPADTPTHLEVPTTVKDPKVVPGKAEPQRASLGDEAELQSMGLKPGTPERAAFDKFIKFFDENAATKTDKPWVFYTKAGDNTDKIVLKFRDDYAAGKHRLPGDAPDGTLHNFIDVFDYNAIPKQLGPGPKPNEDLWYDGVLSFASARLASTRGGPVRILIPKGQDILPPHKSWTDFEAFEITKPDSKVTELWRYDSNNPEAPPELAWSRARGDAPLGVQPNFHDKMVWWPNDFSG